ncbi:hypothetical protein CW670_04170 [Macrococcoides caseolyticum]|uniref:YopX family protein n=1 Tax=Macrococcoides caseolyticum TaxID=69966 RepID=UPI000C328C38|nr:YopX family protein [Macrococcus caseolyticus]PKE36358.1 hypothetical protein CW695_03150 [Macrococcus caseolyticus]PKE74915.1 hypothetical protein CW670_04170 [Macrococcus caseolyticus]VUC68915.1 yopX family protein [Macrococcus caseolyticus]VUC68946.1 yopX family protein [Macrococcus caseolyticus]
MITKFRAWDKEKKLMNIVDGIHFDEDKVWEISCHGVCWKNIRYYTLMQSTGLVDENKAEVFQDDIVWHDQNEDYGIVEIDEAKFVIRWQDGYVEDLFERIDLLEVVGNIHEHSHLLEKENDE